MSDLLDSALGPPDARVIAGFHDGRHFFDWPVGWLKECSRARNECLLLRISDSERAGLAAL